MTHGRQLHFTFLNGFTKLGSGVFSWRAHCSPEHGDSIKTSLHPFCPSLWCSHSRSRGSGAFPCGEATARVNSSFISAKWKPNVLPSHQRAKSWRVPDSGTASVQLQHKNLISTWKCYINMFALLFTEWPRNALYHLINSRAWAAGGNGFAVMKDKDSRSNGSEKEQIILQKQQWKSQIHPKLGTKNAASKQLSRNETWNCLVWLLWNYICILINISIIVWIIHLMLSGHECESPRGVEFQAENRS